MSDPNDLTAFLTEAWAHLAKGVIDSTSPARYPTFATTAPDGTPQARTVVLRRADQGTATVDVHTDILTDKIAALRERPCAALHIWLPDADLQIRITSDVDILTGPQVSQAWTQVPPTSRVSYGTTPAPGTPIDHVFDYDKPPDQSRFAVLACHLIKIDLIHLGAQHRRAQFHRKDGWTGIWVAP